MVGLVAFATLWIPLAGVVASSPFPSSQPLDRTPAPLSQQGNANEEVERLKAELRLVGPEARLKRESAVAALLGMRAPAAHAALQEFMATEKDPDDVIPAILDQLVPRLGNPKDPVLGTPSSDGGRRVRSSYVPSLVLLVGGAQPRDQAVVDRATDGLVAFASWERVEAFTELLSGPDRDARLAAVRAAAVCRDLSLAQVLGSHLGSGDPEFDGALNTSLAQLTFRREPFGESSEFFSWFEQVKHKSFAELAEQAAQQAAADLRRQQRESDDRIRELLLELVEAYVVRPEVDWAALHRLMFSDRLPGATLACLRRLRDLLPRVPALTGTAADRLALLDELMQSLDAATLEGQTEERALLLAVCAHMVIAGEEQSAAVVQRLRDALDAEDKEIRRSALAGLGRFPSEDNRRRVVEAAHGALTDSENELLHAALLTLNSQDWVAPGSDDPGHGEWLRLVKDTLRRPEVPREVRQQALQVLFMHDASNARVADSFNTVVFLVEDVNQDPRFRHYALVQLERDVSDAKRGYRYVNLLEKCLEDSVTKIRLRAAQEIRALPAELVDKEQLATWTERLLEVGRRRLLTETDPAVHRALKDSMQFVAEDRVDPSVVITHFSSAVEEFAQAEERPAFRREHLVAALRVLAQQEGVAPADWVRAAEALLALQERDAVRAILGQHLAPGEAALADAALVQRVQLLTVRAALLRTGDTHWNTSTHVAEAEAVLAAAQELSDAGALPVDPAIALLRMTIHRDFGRHEAAVELGKALATTANGSLDPESRRRLVRSLAESEIALHHFVEARNWLLELTGGGGAVADDLLALLERVGRGLVDEQKFTEAVDVGNLLVQHTPDTSPRFPHRCLIWGDAKVSADPATAAEVRKLLETHASRFQGEGVAPELASAYTTLMARVSG